MVDRSVYLLFSGVTAVGCVSTSDPVAFPPSSADSTTQVQLQAPPATSARGSSPPTPEIHALQGNQGVVVWTDVAGHEKVFLQRTTAREARVVASGRNVVWGEAHTEADASYRLVDSHLQPVTDPAQPRSVTTTLSQSRAEGFYYNGDPIELKLSLRRPADTPQIYLALAFETLMGTQWYDSRCVEDPQQPCWTDTLESLQPIEQRGTAEVELQSLQAYASQSTTATLSAHVGVLLGDGSWLALDRSEVSLLLPGFGVAWGDLHAHTNLSYDGCEDPEDGCADSAETAAADFFHRAYDYGLQFAALTDHAEYTEYCPEGEEGDCLDIWEETLRLVHEADQTWSAHDFVPILGYEWTWNREGDEPAGHKTVLLEATEACEAWRVAARAVGDPYVKLIYGEVYYGNNEYVATSVPDLWEALDEAAESCGDLRALTFFHHTANYHPEYVDWTDEDSAPDEHYETLVEVFSEHGSGECADPEAEGCAWNISDDVDYMGAEGSVQTALAQGFALGFVGGTDSHDARPGTALDGGSCTARWLDQDDDGVRESLLCHEYGGSLTGVLVRGELKRSAIFDALEARHTLVSSGPRIPVRAVGIGPEGDFRLPGDFLGDVESSIDVVVSVDGLLEGMELELEAIQLVDAQNTIRAETRQPTLETTLALSSGDAVYTRILLEDLEGRSHRILLSPWFKE